MSAGITPLDCWLTPKTGASKPGISSATAATPDICPVCAPKSIVKRGRTRSYSRVVLPVLRKARLARDYVVRCCSRCGRCYFYDNQNKRLIELTLMYEDIFGRDENE